MRTLHSFWKNPNVLFSLCAYSHFVIHEKTFFALLSIFPPSFTLVLGKTLYSFLFFFKSFFLLFENTFKIEGLCARSPPYVTSLGILDEVSATVRHCAGDVADLADFRCVGTTLFVTLS